MIDLATAKAHLRVDTADEDLVIQAYLNAAIRAVQDATGSPLPAASVTQTVDGFPSCDRAIRLWKGPVAVTPAPVIKYDDPDGVEQTLASFRLVEGSNARLLPAYGAQWPATAAGQGTVRLTYTAGYAANAVPSPLDVAVLLLTGHFYMNREAVLADTRAAAVELPLGVEALIAPYCPPGIG